MEPDETDSSSLDSQQLNKVDARIDAEAFTTPIKHKQTKYESNSFHSDPY